MPASRPSAANRPPAIDRRTGPQRAITAPSRLPGQPRPAARPAAPSGPPGQARPIGPRDRTTVRMAVRTRESYVPHPRSGPPPAARPAEAATNGGPRRGGYNPALDGVRALAVLSVLVFHMDALPGGYLGVDIFFVLSGFLITGQLLAERDRTGGVSLTRFYLRRAYRLMPAFWLLALVGLTVVVVLGIGSAGERTEFLHSLAASMLYVNNYVQIVGQSTGAGWLGHTWSLSLEEQFYLVWPLVLLALCNRRWLARRLPAVLLAGVLVVTLWRDLLDAFGASGTRTYFALDTRADALLVGCALAAWLRAARGGADDDGTAGLAWRRRLDRVRGLLPVAGPIALGALVVAALTAPSGWGPRPTLLAQGGYTVVALLAGVLVLALEQGASTGWLFRGLAAAPLVWLGRISYGFYLWHFPVVAHWGPDLTKALGRWPATLVIALIATACAATSYYLVERPIQRRRPGGARPAARAGGRYRRPALSAIVPAGDGSARPEPEIAYAAGSNLSRTGPAA